MKMAHEKAEKHEKPSSILERIALRKAPGAPSVGKRGVMAKTKDWEAWREEQFKPAVKRLGGAIQVQGKENEAFLARIQGKTRELQDKMREVQDKTRTYARDFYYG
jgi:hypothetical protein